MSIIYLLIPLAIILAAVALIGFLWAVHRGQFDDLDTPPIRSILDDDDEKYDPIHNDEK